MGFEGFLACLRNGVGGVCLSSDKTFLHFNKTIFFQTLDVRREIAIGDLYQFFQLIEIDVLIHHENTHDAQANPDVKKFIKIFYRILHTG